MDWILRDLVEPFERMPAADAATLLRDQFGVTASSLQLLDTERDDTFRVRTADGDLVLKIAHPADDPNLIDLQVGAMQRALDRGVPVQRLIPSASGALAPTVDGRVVRLLSWLPGGLLGDANPTLEQVGLLGAALARLAASVADLDHPAAHRTIAWDLQSFAVLRDAERPPLTTAVLDAFDELDLAVLPRQFIHNDFNLGNVLVDARESAYVVGVLDFGDALVGPRIQDVAVALAYLVPQNGDPAPVIAAFTEGYGTLSPAETDALPTLIAARLVQRITIPPLLGAGAPPAALIRTLENLLRTL